VTQVYHDTRPDQIALAKKVLDDELPTLQHLHPEIPDHTIRFLAAHCLWCFIAAYGLADLQQVLLAQAHTLNGRVG
jgi:hypothetical protein